MKRVGLVIIFFIVITLWMSLGELLATPRQVCPECERQATDLVSAYKDSRQEKGKIGEGSPDSKKVNETKDILFKCLRYYGYSGSDADVIIEELIEDLEGEANRVQRP